MKVEFVSHQHDPPWEYGCVKATPGGIALEPTPGSHEDMNRHVLQKFVGEGPPPGEDAAAWLRRMAKSFRGPVVAEVDEQG